MCTSCKQIQVCWDYLKRKLTWHWCQSTTRPCIYSSLRVKSRPNPSMEPTSTISNEGKVSCSKNSIDVSILNTLNQICKSLVNSTELSINRIQLNECTCATFTYTNIYIALVPYADWLRGTCCLTSVFFTAF